MKYVKILGLLAVAAAALMAFAGSASATSLTDPTGTVTTGPIHAVSEESAVAGTNHVLLHNESASIQCNSTVEATVTSHGPGVTAVAHINTLTFTNCTENWTVTVVNKGTLEIHWTSGYNGTLTSNGATVTAVRHTIFGDVTCNYATNNTDIGILTGGNPATLHIEAGIPIEGGSSFLCGSGKANWTGKYVTTTQLYVDQN